MILKLFLPLLGYLLGSVSSAIIISKLKGLEDPRNVGSGNPGATNVLRSGDKTAAALTLLGDVLKGTIPIIIAKALGASPVLIALTGMAAFLGHLYPLYYQFKGGKGVATAGGVFLGIAPLIVLLLIIIWFVLAFLTRYSSFSALVAAACAPILFFFLLPLGPYILLSTAIAILLIWRHRENIKRLLNSTEGKINF